MPFPLPHEMKEYVSFVNVTAPFDASSKAGTAGTTFATAWVKIEDQGGQMDAEDMQHQTQLQGFEIWCRYIDGLTGFMQIHWGSRILIITGPPQKTMDSKGRLWWLIAAQEITEHELT